MPKFKIMYHPDNGSQRTIFKPDETIFEASILPSPIRWRFEELNLRLRGFKNTIYKTRCTKSLTGTQNDLDSQNEASSMPGGG